MEALSWKIQKKHGWWFRGTIRGTYIPGSIWGWVNSCFTIWPGEEPSISRLWLWLNGKRLDIRVLTHKQFIEILRRDMVIYVLWFNGDNWANEENANLGMILLNLNGNIHCLNWVIRTNLNLSRENKFLGWFLWLSLHQITPCTHGNHARIVLCNLGESSLVSLHQYYCCETYASFMGTFPGKHVFFSHKV